MSQYLYLTVSPGSTGYTSPTLYSQEKGHGPPIANLSAIETGGTAATIILRGPDGDTTINLPAGSSSNPGQAMRFKKKVSQVLIKGNGSTVTIDLSGPDEYTLPQYLSAIAGSVTIANPPTNYALETGGNLASVAGSSGATEALLAQVFVNFPSGLPKAMNGGLLTGNV
jgi:hypothetical protein